jgi:SAM-dependent methyltransferase
MEEYIDIQFEKTKDFYKILTGCRLCGSNDLHEYLDLGLTPPADQFRKKEELEYPEMRYPLKVLLCKSCGLSQLSHIVNPKILYQFDYPYESSTTKTGKIHWDKFAADVAKRLDLQKNDLVVDIGSNVGTLLGSFKDLGLKVMGIDPAPNMVEIANKNGIETICDFFGVTSADEVIRRHGKAMVIVGTNVFAHINDLHKVMRMVTRLLHENGVFIFESPYFKHLVHHLEYDTIYHEHLSYLSVKPLIPFFSKFGMEVFAIEESEIHGGSMRVYIGKKGLRTIDPNVTKMLEEEKEIGLHSEELMKDLANRVAKNRKDLMHIVKDLISQGKTIAIVSTPAKGMTLLNYCGITNRHVSFATEKSKLKIGRYTPGGHIKIVPDSELLVHQPDYALLLAWNFSKEIMENLKEYKDKGGKFIIPIPEPKIV